MGAALLSRAPPVGLGIEVIGALPALMARVLGLTSDTGDEPLLPEPCDV